MERPRKDDEDLEYVTHFKEFSVPFYIELFKLGKKCLDFNSHFFFLSNCKERGVVPKGLRIKLEPQVSTKNTEFLEQWKTNLAKTERETVCLTAAEYGRLFQSTQINFWNTMYDSLSQCKDTDIFLNWWLKFYDFTYIYSRKLEKRKIKKLKNLLKEEPEANLINIGSISLFLDNIEEFSRTLPRDTQILGDLLTLDVTQESSDVNENVDITVENINTDNEGEIPGSGRVRGRFVSKNVVNLSQRELTRDEISLLSEGLNFAPTPLSIDISELKEDLERFGRSLRLKCFFRESERDFTDNPFKRKSNFNPAKTDAAIEIYLSRLSEDLINKANTPQNNRFDNLTKNERAALKGLMEDNNIIIKGADKGSAVVVWDKEDYLTEAECQLGDSKVYEKVKEPLPALNKSIKSCLAKIKKRRDVSVETLDYFMINNPRLGRFYLLPKIHKRLEEVPGRPVVSNTKYHTENISAYLDHHLKPIAQKVKSYVKDTNDFLRKIRDLQKISRNAILCTIDVVGLYPSIPHDEGLNVLKKVLGERDNINVSSETLLDLASLVLKNSYFEFDNEYYLQKQGTAIGTKMAPSYAILFMDSLETRFLESCDKKPTTWWRYIDDIFLVWEHGEKALREFLEKLNSFHPTIKFTSEWSENNINFLDVALSKKDDGTLVTDLYTKPTDTHQYLHSTSCHPYYCKRSIPYS